MALYQEQIKRGKGQSIITVPYRIGNDCYEPEYTGEVAEEEN